MCVLEHADMDLSAVLHGTGNLSMDETVDRGAHIAHMLDLAVQIMDGLVYIHSMNVQHLDLKPQNVLLKQLGDGYIAKLADFGMTYDDDDAEQAPQSSQNLPTTSTDCGSANRLKEKEQSDMIKISPVGTWEYMAPGKQCI